MSVERLHPPQRPKLHAATIADVWRLEREPSVRGIEVRHARPEDFQVLRDLAQAARPGVPAATFQQLEHQHAAFPAGQFVALSGESLVGFASTLVVQWDHYALDTTWGRVTGDGYFSTHDATGRTLYSAEFVVDPQKRGHGVGRALYRAQRKLCQSLNLRRIITAARLAGYGTLREAMPPELYAKRVVWGDIPDPMMRFHLAQGFQYCGVIRDYQAEDAEAAGHAALMVWLNPRYLAPRPPALVVRKERRAAA